MDRENHNSKIPSLVWGFRAQLATTSVYQTGYGNQFANVKRAGGKKGEGTGGCEAVLKALLFLEDVLLTSMHAAGCGGG